MSAPLSPDRTLALAEAVAEAAESLGIRAALIGGGALAVHGYPRATEDLDLAVVTHPFIGLRKLRDALERQGYETRLIEPDEEDPLGGVLTVAGEGFEPIQVINYYNPLRPTPNPGEEAVQRAQALIEDSRLRVVRLPELIALKLYAGGTKSALDVKELLERNPDAPREELREVCARHGLLRDLEPLLDES